MSNISPWCFTEEAAEILRTEQYKVVRAIKRGEIKARKIGKRWYVLRADIMGEVTS